MLVLSQKLVHSSSALYLAPFTTHIWLADFSAADHKHENHYLSNEEYKQSEQYKFPRDCQSFVARRSTLRRILGMYLATAPESIKFVYNKYGKPFLANSSKNSSINFNISHSNDIALYIFSRTFEVGIDIEKIKPIANVLDIADKFFSPVESSILKSMPENMRLQTFYKYWTKKEAFIKVQGKGLSHPLNKFNVTLAAHEIINEQCSLTQLNITEHYAAAFAIAGNCQDVNFWKYTVKT